MVYELLLLSEVVARLFLNEKALKDLFSELYILAVRTGLEPATPCVTGMYSNQLNYRTFLYRITAVIPNCGAKI